MKRIVMIMLTFFVGLSAQGLFFSEYIEGNSYNKALEIYNPTDAAIDLSGYAFPSVSNAPTVPGEYEYWNSFSDGATIAPGDVYVIAHPDADPAILTVADQTFQYLSNGDDGFALVQGTEDSFVAIDWVGDWNGDPGSGWEVCGSGLTTANQTLVRSSSVTSGSDWAVSSAAETCEWDIYDVDTFTYLGSHTSGEVTTTAVTFSLDMSNEEVSVDGVHIAGSMQGWDPAASEMTDEDADGVYEITFELTAGDTLQYTFLNGNGWSGQEDNTGLEDCGVDNGWGAYNRVHVVGAADETVGPVCFSSCISCDQVYVTFQVDMANEEVSADGVHIAGSMQGWDPAASEMTDEDADGVYEYTFALTTGEMVYFKYVNGNGWDFAETVPSDCEDGGNRYYTVGEMGEVIPAVCFGSCEGCVPPNIVEAVVTFQADMTNFVGFDPSVHTLEVRGSFNGWGDGDVLQPDLVDPNLYLLDVTISENVGNEVFWKFKANPDEDWNNTGWESGDNKVFDWTGENIVLEAEQPNILPAGAPLNNEVTITFAVEWIDGVLNVNTGEAFPQKPDTLVFNGSYLNGWYTWGDCMGEGCETPASPLMPHLADGDGDNIFTGTLVLPAGHDNLFMAKFGAWYPGIEVDAPGSNGAIDNEAGFGQDRVVLIDVDATEYTFETIFGINNPDNDLSIAETEIIPEKFALKGNYPNPFNPETRIMFDLDITSHVVVKVYSLLGEEVVTLYDGQAIPGEYSVKWNARNTNGRIVPSGVYLYSVSSNQRTFTGKMLLMK